MASPAFLMSALRSNADQKTPSLIDAAAFILTGEDNMARRSDRMLVNSIETAFVNATDDPCVFQYREIFQPYNFKQIDFRKANEVWVGFPPARHFLHLKIRGMKGVYCAGTLTKEMAADPKFLLRDDSCEDEMDIAEDNRGDLKRRAEATRYISNNFCPYGGKPY
jgi:hypothetical protein